MYYYYYYSQNISLHFSLQSGNLQHYFQLWIINTCKRFFSSVHFFFAPMTVYIVQQTLSIQISFSQWEDSLRYYRYGFKLPSANQEAASVNHAQDLNIEPPPVFSLRGSLLIAVQFPFYWRISFLRCDCGTHEKQNEN